MNDTKTSSPPLMQNEYVQELFSILKDNGRDTSGLSALLGHVSEMENFVKRAEDKIADMKSQLVEMKEVQNHPVKTALTNAIKTLENKVAEVKVQLAELKQNLAEGCKAAVQAFKEKGLSALNNLASFFKIKRGLQGIEKNADAQIAVCGKSIADINRFAGQYHTAGRAIKNMGLMVIGREPVDAKKEAGKLAAVIAAPYKADKAINNAIKTAVGKAISALEQMEQKQAARQSERAAKPDFMAKFKKHQERAEREKLELPVPERSKNKELTV